jgi:hypothetical protein
MCLTQPQKGTKRLVLVRLRVKWIHYTNMTMHFSPFYIIGEQILKNVSSMNNFLIVDILFTLLKITCFSSQSKLLFIR